VATRAAIYCRISSDRDDDRLGVDRQEQDCRTLCEDRGWTVIEPIYVDNNISASGKAERAQYQKLLQDIEQGSVDALAVWDIDRLARKPTELEHFVATCDAAGVTQLAFVGGTIDVATGDGLLVARIKGAVAAEEVRKTGQRIRRKKLEIAESGAFSGGARPFGYEADGMTVRGSEAAVIREAASRILEGSTLYSIRKDWNERGITTAHGKPWSYTSLKTVLTGPRIVGKRQHGKDGDGRPIIIGEAAWPAVVDIETWEALRQVLYDPARKQPPPSRDYPLRGVVVCDECGKFLSAQPDSRKRNYICKKETGGCGRVYVTAKLIEDFVYGILLPLADSPVLRDELRAEDETHREEIRKLVQEKAIAEASLTQLGDDYADGVITRGMFQRQQRRLGGKIKAWEARVGALAGQSALDRLGGSVQAEWDTMKVEDKRLITQSLVSEIRVTPALRRGSNIFDNRRVKMIFRFDPIAKVAKAEGKVTVGSGHVVIKPEWKVRLEPDGTYSVI